jgi:hypothetical protein
MHFDHNGLIQVEAGLDGLQELFTTEEINRIVKNLPSRKSSRLDGFKSDFMKKCWSDMSTFI